MNTFLIKSLGLAICTGLATVARYSLPSPPTTQPPTLAGVSDQRLTRLDGGVPITVFGLPLLGSGVQGNTCPGNFVGYTNYTNTPPEFGWTPATNATVMQATDGTGRTDTRVEYIGDYGDVGCATGSVTIPYPPISHIYVFTIYFPTNPPTTNYPIVLTGFNP